MPESYISTDNNVEDNLIADNQIDLQTEEITLLSGEVVTRGTVLGQVTASGKYRKAATGNGDGSETIKAVATRDKDASGGDVKMIAYFTGSFNKNAMDLSDFTVDEALKTTLRDQHIFLEDSIQA